MSDLVLFDNLPEPSFEDFKHENGSSFWFASDLKIMLGYKTAESFKKAIDRMTKALMTLGIDHYQNITPAINPVSEEADFKLTRFACYLLVMNSSASKPEVAKAQAYFATMTRQFELLIQNPENIERLIIRDDIVEGTKSLNIAASKSGVTDYARFTNAGYLGLYNMMNYQLAKKRNIEKNQLFDHMGRTEMAANLFRITMTEERLRNSNIFGQTAAEITHREVGEEVRKVVMRNTGKTPEQLPVAEKLPEVKKKLKAVNKELQNVDKKQQPKANKKS